MTTIIDAKEYSFLDLFLKEHYEIIIPSIQRDYAQGRENTRTSKIRKDFVSELKSYIFSGKTHSLDFIYGKAENNRFIPLDGQQRLTTLWLLHVYLGSMEGESCDSFHFLYETRDSSSRFCESLLVNARNILTRDSLKDSQTPSSLIQNESWWFGAWIKDPTIKGMLTMLDEINMQFYDVAHEAYVNLYSGEVQPIVFEFLPLEGFHDIDDLYIKMNARGLPLTPFEIFKSKLIEDVEKHLPSMEKEFKADLDVKWSDELWGYRTNGTPNVDLLLERILKIIFANEALFNNNAYRWNSENLDCLFEANDKTVTFSHNWYEEIGVVFDSIFLERVIADLKILLDPETTVLRDNNLNDYDSQFFDIELAVRKWILFGKNMNDDGNITYDTRLKLHAYFHFKQVMKDAENAELTEWMRVIFNLSAATRINSSEEMMKVLKDIELLLNDYLEARSGQGSLTINEWIAKSSRTLPKFFDIYQWNEEVSKAQLRRDSVWRTLIKKAESNSYLRGQIGVTLYLAGLVMQEGDSCNLTSMDFNQIPSPDVYRNVLEKSLPLFEQLGLSNSVIIKDFIMVKAMLSKGDYMPWLSSFRKNFYNRPAHRDYSWKSLFRIGGKSNVTALNCLKEIVSDKNYDFQNLAASLQKITNEHKPTTEWIELLIGEYGTNIMQLSKQGFIAFDVCTDDVLIYYQSRRNHFHTDLKIRVLYECLRNQYNLAPNFDAVKSQEDNSSIYVKRKLIYQRGGVWTIYENGIKSMYKSMDEVINEIMKQ